MTKNITFLLLIIFASRISAQTNYELRPSGLYHLQAFKTINLPEINPDEIISRQRQSWIETGVKSDQFGEELHEVISFNKSDASYVNGEYIWQIRINGNGAKSLSFIFSKFHLPENAKLFIYEPNKPDNTLGAYTAANNNIFSMLGTELLYAPDAILEVNVPEAEVDEISLETSIIVQGFKLPGSMQEYTNERSLNSSGDCNIDVNCPLGAGWEDQRNSVALIIIGGSSCSGSMVNNTSEDGTPYFLSANHCYSGAPSTWVFRFRWESQNPICATASNSTNNPYFSINGAELKARDSNSDMLLLELFNRPQDDWEVFYSGWNKNDNITPVQATGIHHPSADIKKICRESDAPYQQVVSIGGNPNTEMWFIDEWEEGITEGGSSGSPLYNEEKLIIGMLSGGLAACSGTSGNGEYDYYGRFGVAWDFGSTPETRLANWLDPSNSGVETLDGRYLTSPNGQRDAAIDQIVSPNGVTCGYNRTVEIILRNTGIENLQHANIEIGTNNGMMLIEEWQGNLSSGQTTLITIPGVTLSPTDIDFYAKLIDVNSIIGDDFDNNDSTNVAIEVSEKSRTFTFHLTDDYYANEITAFVVENTGDTIFSSPSYPGQTFETTSSKFCASDECINLYVYDSGGDGLAGIFGYPNGDYWITNENDVRFIEMTAPDGNFGSLATHENICVSSVLSNELKNAMVFPNPSSTQINIEVTLDNVETTVVDINGRIIYRGTFDYATQLDVSSYSNGVYFIILSAENSNQYIRFVKN